MDEAVILRELGTLGAKLDAFQREYADGRKAATQVARDNAAERAHTREMLTVLDQRTQATNATLASVEAQAKATNGRVTELERKQIAREAVAGSRRVLVTIASSVASGVILALVGLYLA